MTHDKHNISKTSTCPACREWKRDMDGTVATLDRERAMKKELLESLQAIVPILKAVRYTVGFGKNQLERIERAEAVIKKATGKEAA